MKKFYFPLLGKILLVLLLLLLIPLIAYKITLVSYDFSASQQNIVSYITGSSEELVTDKLTSREVSHLKDVKEVMKFTDFIFYICILLFLVLLYFNRQGLLHLLKKTGLVALVFYSLLVGILLLAFEKAFFIFHTLLFEKGSWVFFSNSYLIQLFPEEFFITISLVIFVLSVLFSFLLFIIPITLKKYFLKN